MILLHAAFFVDILFLPRVLVPVAIGQTVLVVATVEERTVALALVEVLARDFPQCVFVFLNQRILLGPAVHHVVARDNQVRILAADRTGAIVVL